MASGGQRLCSAMLPTTFCASRPSLPLPCCPCCRMLPRKPLPTIAAHARRAGGNASAPSGQNQLLVQPTASPFGVSVLRVNPAGGAPRSTFDSTGQRLIFKEQYIEWSTKLDPASFLYGAGERASETTYITVGGRHRRDRGTGRKRQAAACRHARDSVCTALGEWLAGHTPACIHMRCWAGLRAGPSAMPPHTGAAAAPALPPPDATASPRHCCS